MCGVLLFLAGLLTAAWGSAAVHSLARQGRGGRVVRVLEAIRRALAYE